MSFRCGRTLITAILTAAVAHAERLAMSLISSTTGTSPIRLNPTAETKLGNFQLAAKGRNLI